MAEFCEVMRQAKRMCKEFGNDCAGCGLASSHCPLGPIPQNWDGVNFANVERIVMDWVAKNPEPRYPSWAEAWRQLFPESKFIPCPVSHFGLNRPCEHNCADCKDTQMIADIAEKLGIKPIGTKNDG